MYISLLLSLSTFHSRVILVVTISIFNKIIILLLYLEEKCARARNIVQRPFEIVLF